MCPWLPLSCKHITTVPVLLDKQHHCHWCLILGSVSKDVFERRASTGSEAFSLFICLGANKFVLLSFFSLIKTIYQRVSTKPLPNDAKSPLPVDARRSKTPLLKLPIVPFVSKLPHLPPPSPAHLRAWVKRAYLQAINNWTRLTKISWFVSGELINLAEANNKTLQDTDESRYFVITEFNNCLIIGSLSLFLIICKAICYSFFLQL